MPRRARLSTRRRLTVLGSTLCALATATALVAPAATAHGPGGHDRDHDSHGGSHGQGPKVKGDYLALSDSVPFGYQPAEVAGPPVWADADNLVGYPELLGERHPVTVTNAACPGETSGSLIDVTAQSNGCSNSLGSEFGYRDAFPLHTAYDGSQLDFAVDFLRTHRQTRLVTLTVGANDLFLCQRTTADQCTGASFPAVVGQVSSNVDTILRTLRTQGHYHGRVVLVSYYSTDYRDPFATGSIQALNGALATVADRYRAVVADGFGAVAAGASSSGGDTCAAGLIIALPGGGCNVHPTRAGHALLADAVDAVVRVRRGHH